MRTHARAFPLCMNDEGCGDACYMQIVVLAEVGVLLVMRTERVWGLDHVPHFESEIVQGNVRSFCSRLSMVGATPVITV